MILVTVGTAIPFDRLLRAVDAIPPGEEIIAQTGRSNAPSTRATCIEFLPYDELVAHVRRARVVVAHAGVGSVVTALLHGKRPIVVPRLSRFGETVDDHQLPFARRLHRAGLVTCIEDVDRLPDLLVDGLEHSAVPPQAESGLASELSAYLHTLIATRAREAIPR
jgi:UDP-N-acetylglucosamine transferase subunit ALG13